VAAISSNPPEHVHHRIHERGISVARISMDSFLEEYMATEDRPEDRAGHAAHRPDVEDTPNREGGHTDAGQEARRGIPPGEHDEEHQSEYGGGGIHGGSPGGTSNPK